MSYRPHTLIGMLVSLIQHNRTVGRSQEWIGEWDGKAVLRLYDPIDEEMFWKSYRIEVLVCDPSVSAMVRDRAFWSGNECLNLKWRCPVSGRVAENAFSAPRSYPFEG